MTPLQTLQVMHHLVQQHRTVKEVLQRLQTIVEVDLAPTRVVTQHAASTLARQTIQLLRGEINQLGILRWRRITRELPNRAEHHRQQLVRVKLGARTVEVVKEFLLLALVLLVHALVGICRVGPGRGAVVDGECRERSDNNSTCQREQSAGHLDHPSEHRRTTTCSAPVKGHCFVSRPNSNSRWR